MSFLIFENKTLKEALELINENAKGVIFLQNDKKEVVASLSDGDIRRYLLKSNNLDAVVSTLANYNFVYIKEDEISKAEEVIKNAKISCLPVLGKNKELACVVTSFSGKIKKLGLKSKKINAHVVIMAGGKGTRLAPYSNILPKPLFPIENSTITEKIIEKFKSFGCKDFSIIINYKKDLVKAYFNEIKKDYNLEFIDETIPLKTGGGLSLIKNKVKETFFMTNCDVIVDSDYEGILKYHKKQNNIITLVCVKKKLSLSYGVVELEKERVSNLIEKPEMSFLTSTGFYVIEPRFLKPIKENKAVDITDTIKNCIKENEKVGAFRIEENAWYDMGQPEGLKKMLRFLNIKEKTRFEYFF